jgi:hypothetical protein
MFQATKDSAHIDPRDLFKIWWNFLLMVMLFQIY